jgi:hypothetical protein
VDECKPLARGRYWREPGDGDEGGEGSGGKNIGGMASGGSGGVGAGAIWSRTRDAKDPEASSETPDGDGGRDIHSSTSQLNLSRF